MHAQNRSEGGRFYFVRFNSRRPSGKIGATIMSERNGYIPGVPCWIDVSAPNAQAEAQFYSDLFGWEIENAMPEGSDGDYFIGRIRGGDVAGVGSAADGTPTMWNSYVWVDSVEDAAAKASDAGGT